MRGPSEDYSEGDEGENVGTADMFMLDFLKITQKYFNRYINVFELLETLKRINTEEMADDERVDFSKLVSGIENAIEMTDDKKDELIDEEVAQLESTIKQMEAMKRGIPNLPKEIEDYIERLYDKRGIVRDNLERWTKVSNAIKNSTYYQKAMSSLSDLELLELIANDMRAAYPIEIDEDRYRALIKVGIEQNKREWLWRLAFNYLKEPYDISPIAKYYLDVDDCYYLTELIGVAGEKLNIETILAEVEEKDREFIKHFIESELVINEHVSKEQLESLKKRVGYVSS